MKLVLVFLALAFSNSAFAQQTASPLEQTLLQKLNVEVSSNIQCGVSLITALQELEKSKMRAKELEEKYEPKSKSK